MSLKSAKVKLAALLQPLLLLSLVCSSPAQQTTESVHEEEKIAQESAKVEEAAKLEAEKAAQLAAKERAKRAAAAAKAKMEAEKAKEEAAARAAKLKAEEQKAAEKRGHHTTPPAPTPHTPTPPAPAPAPAPTPPPPPPPSGSVSLPDYLTSPNFLLPSTYHTKRNAYQNPTWYLCPLAGHGSGTAADPFRMDDLPVGSAYYISSSNLLNAMKPGDTLALYPGTYNMNNGSGVDSYGYGYAYQLMVPAGTADNYTDVCAADPTNPPVINGAPGLFNIIGSSEMPGANTIYENLVVNSNETKLCFYIMGTNIVIRNCNVQGNHAPFPGDNHNILFFAYTSQCQVYDNVLWGNDAICTINGSTAPGYYTEATAVFGSDYLDVCHNRLYDNGEGTFNKDSGGPPNGYWLPLPYTDANSYRGNYYADNWGEYQGTNEGPDDTIWVRDNVFAGTSYNNGFYNPNVAGNFFLTYSTIFENNLVLLAGLAQINRTNESDQSNNNYIRNNIIWSPQSVITAYLDYSSLSTGQQLGYMDYNIYIGPAGTSETTVGYSIGSQTYDMFGMRQLGNYELHSGVYSNPSQVFSAPSTYTLLPSFLTAASDGGAPGPRVPIPYITNPGYYGPNAPLNPYGLGVSNGNY